MKFFLKHSIEDFRARAIMIMSSLINEDETHIIEDSGSVLKCHKVIQLYRQKFSTVTGAIKYIVGLVRKAMDSKDHKARAGGGNFSALELMDDLERLAINDSNKLTVLN